MSDITLDFGNFSLDEALARRSANDKLLFELEGMLPEADAYTKGAPRNFNPRTSRSIMSSAWEGHPLPKGVEGRTIADVNKLWAETKSSNAMLDAIIEAKTPIRKTAVTQSVAQIPKVIATATPEIAQAVGSVTATTKNILPQILKLATKLSTGVDLALTSAELNSNEEEELNRRRKQQPYITK